MNQPKDRVGNEHAGSTPWLPEGAAFDPIRTRDWTHTPLGAVEGWPVSLRAAVCLVMQSAVPMALHWGDDLVRLYNDAFAIVAPRPDPPFGGTLAANGMPGPRAVARVREGEVLAGERTVLHKDGGSGQVFDASHSPVRDEAGAIRGILTCLTESVSASARLIVQHRMRNAIAIMRSVARRTAETSESAEQYAEHFEGRLAALARGQMLLGDPESGVSLEEIVTEEMLAQSARARENVRIEGPPVALSFDAAGTFGLALHELTVNAVEHGAFDEDDSEIAASWTVTETGDLRFDWLESGAPVLSSDRPGFPHSGFGREVLERTLPYELDARTELTRTRDGVRCRIELPSRYLVRSGDASGVARSP